MRYILYARKSSEDKGRQILSLESQIAEMTRLADSLGLEIVKVFQESKSAKKPDNRPLFAQMIKLLEQDEAEGVICWKIDRLSRNPIDSGKIQWLMQQGKIKVIQTMEKQYLPSDNVILLNVESGMANQYILDLSKNVKRGIKTKLEKGDYPNRAPIGYLNDITNKKLIIDPERVKFIKMAFDLYAKGTISIKELAEELYKKGFTSRSGIKYHKSKVHFILQNTFYHGVILMHGKYYQGNHEPIISKTLYDEVQNVLNGKNKARRKHKFFSYRGFMYCENCGCLITADQKKGHNYYYCTNGKGNCEEHKEYLREDKLTEKIATLFEKLKFDNEFIELCYQADMEKAKFNNTDIDRIKESLEKRLLLIGKQKLSLLDLELAQKFPSEVIEAKMTALGKEEAGLNVELKKANEAKVKYSVRTFEQTKKVFLEANLAQKDFLEADEFKRRIILEKLLSNLSIQNKEIANFEFKMPYQQLANVADKADFELMRWDRDSNSRYPFGYTTFRESRLQPLGHPTKLNTTLTKLIPPWQAGAERTG